MWILYRNVYKSHNTGLLTYGHRYGYVKDARRARKPDTKHLSYIGVEQVSSAGVVVFFTPARGSRA